MASKLTNCKSCGKEVAKSAKSCPNCGAKIPKPIFKRWWFWVLVIIILSAIVSGAGGNDGTKSTIQSASTASTTKATIDSASTIETSSESTTVSTTTAEEIKFIKPGMYKVGSEIKAGEYVIFANYGTYYEILKDSNGTLDSIIANEIVMNQSVVDLKEGVYFNFKDGELFPIEDAPIIEPIEGKLQEGMYKVGLHIKAGEYKIVPDNSGMSYLEVAKDAQHTLNSIVSNDILSGEKYITIKDGQYITVKGAYILVG